MFLDASAQDAVADVCSWVAEAVKRFCDTQKNTRSEEKPLSSKMTLKEAKSVFAVQGL